MPKHILTVIAALMSLVLAGLVSYREYHPSPGLDHVTVVEEAHRILAAGPIAYFSWLLVQQILADRPALVDPRPDLSTVLALAAVAYLGLLLASYWRKPLQR